MRRWFVCVLTFAIATAAHAQSDFPYDRDLVLDARPMRGSKRVPVLVVGADGRAQIDLWCKRGQEQVVVDGNAITIMLGTMSAESCTPERAQADEEMIAALSGVASWSLRGDVVTLAGAKTMRFFLASH